MTCRENLPVLVLAQSYLFLWSKDSPSHRWDKLSTLHKHTMKLPTSLDKIMAYRTISMNLRTETIYINKQKRTQGSELTVQLHCVTSANPSTKNEEGDRPIDGP